MEEQELSDVLAASPPRTPKFEAEASLDPFRSPSPSDSCPSDTDDDDCIDLLASLEISNEANVSALPLGFPALLTYCFAPVGSHPGQKQSRRLDTNTRVR